MSLQPCQEDAYAERGWSNVESCTAVGDGHYAVIVDHSVLYPEGGGQPADRGTIGGAAVLDVQKDASARSSPGERGPSRSIEHDSAPR